MSMPQFNAYIRGYKEKIRNEQYLSIQTGYYTAYYLSNSHAKSPEELVTPKETKSVKQIQQTDIERFEKLDKLRSKEVNKWKKLQ